MAVSYFCCFIVCMPALPDHVTQLTKLLPKFRGAMSKGYNVKHQMAALSPASYCKMMINKEKENSF